MADLSTLSETSPADTDVIAQGASAIRDTRASTKTSVALEHGLAGEHKFPQGNTASRVAYALGRLYLNTQQRAINQGIAGSWAIAPAINIASFFNATVFSLTGSFADWATATVLTPTGAFLFMVAYVELLLGTSNGAYSMTGRFRLDGTTTIDPGEQTFYQYVPAVSLSLPLPAVMPFVMPAVYTAVLPEGSHTVAFQMKFNGGAATPTIRNRFMGVIVG